MLVESLQQLESNKLSLVESMSIFRKVLLSLKSTPGPIGKKAFEKLTKSLDKNPGYSVVEKIASVLEGQRTELPEAIKICDVSKYKFIPVTSCNVERSFSMYKMILTDRRHRLTEDNLEKLIICYANKSFSESTDIDDITTYIADNSSE